MVRLRPFRYRKFSLRRLLAGLMVMLTSVVVISTFMCQRSVLPIPSVFIASGSPVISVNYLEPDCELCNDKLPTALDRDARSSRLLVRKLGQEKMQLQRHFDGFEPWPERELDLSLPGKLPPTVHYLWCTAGFSLGFHHYLGILSAVRLLQPTKFVFHYDILPRLDHDMYYSWFMELKQSLPSLVLRPLPKGHPTCGSPELLDLALSFLQKDGGIFLGSNLVISRLPRDLASTTTSGSSSRSNNSSSSSSGGGGSSSSSSSSGKSSSSNTKPFWFAFAAPDSSSSSISSTVQQGIKEKGIVDSNNNNNNNNSNSGAAKEVDKKQRGRDLEIARILRVVNIPDSTRGLVVAWRGFSEAQRKEYLQQILGQTRPQCVTKAAFNSEQAHVQKQPKAEQEEKAEGYGERGGGRGEGGIRRRGRREGRGYGNDLKQSAPCVTLPNKPDIYPADIMTDASPFSELARWLYYGTRSPMRPQRRRTGGEEEEERGGGGGGRGGDDPIPRITHLIWFNVDDSSKNEDEEGKEKGGGLSPRPPSTPPTRRPTQEMRFQQFLTVLSALYVGGFEHVYIHGNCGFRGFWWDQLKNRGENVTLLHLDDPEVVYQQAVTNPSHKSDVTRYLLLHKYGGAYQDFDAVWTQRVPDWLLEYPCVASYDWAAYGEFPAGINPGVLLAKRHAPWLRYHLASHRYYVEENFVWNAVLMSYRTYERHPDQILLYERLQVMCDFGICHPAWEPGYRRDIKDRRPTVPFDWRKDTLAVHVTRPDPVESFNSPKALRDRSDIFAEIGRNILQKSGRMKLIE